MVKLYPCFQHWCAEGTMWIYSDPHFEDKDCKLMCEDWPSPEYQIMLLNDHIGRKDTLILLGDVGNPEWVNKIKGKNKILITGNHDRGNSIYEPYFTEVYNGRLFINDRLLLSHEPAELSDTYFNIHGHVHNDTHPKTDYSMNVCADCVAFLPVNLTWLLNHGILQNVHNYHKDTVENAKAARALREFAVNGFNWSNEPYDGVNFKLADLNE